MTVVSLSKDICFNRQKSNVSPYSLGDVAKGVDCGPPDGLLVSLEKLQQLKADPHPLSRRHKLRPPVCDPTNQIYAILLYLLMSEIEKKLVYMKS